ncbi:hypothetical protein MRX96_027686 [Rhipicephalus microplus]
MEDSEMDTRSRALCDLCKSVACGCSELSDTSYPSTPVSPIAGEPETYVHRLGQIKSFDATLGTRSYWGFGTSGSRGVAIVLMPRFTGTVLRYFRDSDGRLMPMDIDSGFRIVNVYASNDFRSQKDFFAALDNHLVGPSRVVLVGDFNCMLDRIDRRTFRGTATKWTDRRGEGALRELVDELGLIDAWHALRLAQSGMTWAGRSTRSRIDTFTSRRHWLPVCIPHG